MLLVFGYEINRALNLPDQMLNSAIGISPRMEEDLDELAPSSIYNESEGGNKKRNSDGNVLQFLDSVDDYVTLVASLSSTLSQGWMELASARHSMGATRVSSVLFDLKSHSAVTTLQLDQDDKWGLHDTGAKQLNDNEEFKKHDVLQLRRRGSMEATVGEDITKDELPAVDLKVQKELSKSLSVFGALVSPKLRSAKLSFETAMETLVIVLLANKRSSLQNAADNVRKDMEFNRP